MSNTLNPIGKNVQKLVHLIARSAEAQSNKEKAFSFSSTLRDLKNFSVGGE